MNPLDLLLDAIEAVIASGEEIPDELAGELAVLIRELADEEDQGAGIPPTPPPLPEGTELLWQLAGGHPDAFANYLRTVPDRALNQLLQDPDRLEQIVQDLHERFPPQEPIEAHGVVQAPLQSSNIWGFNYDPDSRRLRVRFQGGSTYEYDNVPPYIYSIFHAGAVPARTSGQNEFGRWWIGKNPSLGAAFYAMIRSGPYPYERVA